MVGSPGGATSPDGGNRADEGISLIEVAGNATATSFRLRGDYVALDGMPYQYRLYAYGPGLQDGAADDGRSGWRRAPRLTGTIAGRRLHGRAHPGGRAAGAGLHRCADGVVRTPGDRGVQARAGQIGVVLGAEGGGHGRFRNRGSQTKDATEPPGRGAERRRPRPRASGGRGHGVQTKNGRAESRGLSTWHTSSCRGSAPDGGGHRTACGRGLRGRGPGTGAHRRASAGRGPGLPGRGPGPGRGRPHGRGLAGHGASPGGLPGAGHGHGFHPGQHRVHRRDRRRGGPQGRGRRHHRGVDARRDQGFRRKPAPPRGPAARRAGKPRWRGSSPNACGSTRAPSA
ncbi:hypothetical protein CDEN61S_03392 [Castellaniella denitrificans]